MILPRERAANWSKGVGALLVAALAFSLIKGRDDNTSLGPKLGAGVGICLVLAAVLATIAAYKLFRACYGPLTAISDSVTDHQEATGDDEVTRLGSRSLGPRVRGTPRRRRRDLVGRRRKGLESQ